MGRPQAGPFLGRFALRVRILASAYALNSSHLEGRPASEFLDTSSAAQTKLGPLNMSATTPGTHALVAGGTAGGGVLFSIGGTGFAYVGTPDTGIQAQGSVAGGRFDQTNGFSSAQVARGSQGILASGTSSG